MTARRARQVDRLPPVSLAERRRLLAGSRRGMPHSEAFGQVPAMDELVLAGFGDAPDPAPDRMRVGAWNVQHCHFPAEGAALLAAQDFDLVLLSELDIGMRRTGQIETPRVLAEGQGHGYVFGVEFLELRPPDAAGEENASGFHGNGLTAARRPLDTALVRLAPEADWFVNPRRDQHRVGGRMAVLARFALGRGTFVAVSVHLESDTDAAGRARQMRTLLQAVDAFAPGEPVLIGGDLNAGARTASFDFRSEALFAIAAESGYDWQDCNLEQSTSRVSRVQNAVQQAQAHYDWFFARGLRTTEAAVIEAVDDDGQALSDHEVIAVTVEPAT